MGKRIHHMGMTLTKEEHERFHKQAPSLNPKKHDVLMKRLGVTKEEDEEWHRTHLTLGEQRALAGMNAINPLAAGAGFIAWCTCQGWVVQRGKQFFATKEGTRELRERFGIRI